MMKVELDLQTDSTKFREKTGWEPKKNLEDICDDLLTYWRKEIK